MKRILTIIIAVLMMFSMVALFVPALQLFAGSSVSTPTIVQTPITATTTP